MNRKTDRMYKLTFRTILGVSLGGWMAMVVSCGPSDSETPTEASVTESSDGGSVIVATPAVEKKVEHDDMSPRMDADVVGVSIGMEASAVTSHLEAGGWALKTQRSKIANIPGIDPLEYPDMLHFERRVPRDGYEDFELLGLHFLAPVPPEEARIYMLTFDRRSVPIGTPANATVRSALTVTPEYSNSMLALVKKKYGAPDAVQEGACTTRGGPVVESIPIYEVHYFTDVRAYGDAALLIKIADTCRQQMSIRMEDGDWARGMRQRFTDFSQQQLEKVSASSGREVDF